MRTREEVQRYAETIHDDYPIDLARLQLEVLLDIRDLLLNLQPPVISIKEAVNSIDLQQGGFR